MKSGLLIGVCIGPLALTSFVVACGQVQDVGYTDRDAGALGGGDGAADGDGSSSSDGAPTIECNDGLTACGTSCTDLTKDGANCGRCGRTCAGCDQGMCPRQTLVSTTSSPVSIDVLPNRLLADAKSLYWTSAHCVTRANKDGTAAGTIACPDSAPDGHFTMDAANLYWTSSTSNASGAIFVAAKGGTSASVLLELPSVRPFGLAVEASSKTLFFGDLGVGQDPSMFPSRIGYTSVTAPVEKTLGTAAVKFFRGIAVTKTAVFATASDTGRLIQIARPAGEATTLAFGFSNPIDVIVDGTDAYVVDAGFDIGPTPGSIFRIPLGGDGEKFPVAAGLSNPEGIAVDADYIYFTTNGTSTNNYLDGSVMRVPKTGGSPLPLARNEGFPRGIAVDADFVYWANHGASGEPGAIVRTPR
jgi:sugar lactone lactonase YvrE